MFFDHVSLEAVTKMGLPHFAVAYVKTDSPVSGEEADTLREETETVCAALLNGTKAELVIAATVASSC